MSLGEPFEKPRRGSGMLLEHLAGIEQRPRHDESAYERLCAAIGVELAGMLVRALALGPGSGRRDLVA